MKRVFNKTSLYFILLTFTLLLLITPLVFAQSTNPFRNWFANWEEGNLSAGLIKYLLWALVSMMVYSVGHFIPGLNTIFANNGEQGQEFKQLIGAAFAIIVGFLAMAYITPEEISVMMISYSALGFTFGGLIPFLVMFGWTISMMADSTNPRTGVFNLIIVRGAWIAFSAFIIYRLIATIGQAPDWYSWSLFFIALGCLIFNFGFFNTALRKIRKLETDMVVLNERVKEAKANAVTDARARSASTTPTDYQI